MLGFNASTISWHMVKAVNCRWPAIFIYAVGNSKGFSTVGEYLCYKDSSYHLISTLAAANEVAIAKMLEYTVMIFLAYNLKRSMAGLSKI